MPLSTGFYRTISYQNASSKPEQRTNEILKYHPAFASRHTALHARSHAAFRIIYSTLFVLYICNLSCYIFATFRNIYSKLFVLYNPLRIIKSHFRIIKLGYALKNLFSYCK